MQIFDSRFDRESNYSLINFAERGILPLQRTFGVVSKKRHDPKLRTIQRVASAEIVQTVHEYAKESLKAARFFFGEMILIYSRKTPYELCNNNLCKPNPLFNAKGQSKKIRTLARTKSSKKKNAVALVEI